jgi:glycosyltransferase involved in cell wall biosynthesis
MGPRLDLLEVVQPPDGGAAEHVRLLVLGLRERGHAVTVAAPPESSARADIEAAGANFVGLPLVGNMLARGRDRAAARGLRALLAERHFDLVAAHAQKAGLLARPAARRAGVPAIYTPHLFVYRTQLLRPRLGSGLRFLLTRAAERRLGRTTAAIIAVSEDERRAAIEDGIAPPERVRTILNGVAPDLAIPADPELLAFRGDGPLFGFVAGLRDQKGLPTLLDALDLLAARGALPRFAIVGNGPLEDLVRRRLAAPALAGRVRHFAFGGRVEPYLRALDVFVLPSYWEGLPLAVLEAMALGVAPVASAVGGTPETIRDGETGWLFASGDAAALAARLEELAQHPELARRAGAAAAVVAARDFGVERMIDETEALYLEIAGGGRAAG